MSYKTIHIVDLTSDAHFIKECLEIEDISVRLMDEDKPDLNYEYSPESGVKIQVQEIDFDKSRSILIRLGHINILDKNTSTLEDINDFTKKIFFMKDWNLIWRLIFVAGIGFVILLALMLLMYNFN